MRKLTLALTTLLMTIVLSSAAAYADSVSLVLTNPVSSISQSGGTVTYDAILSAPDSNGAAVYIYGSTANFDPQSGDASGLQIDTDDLLFNFPAFLNPGDSVSGDLFTVTVPAGTAFGDYTGYFTLQGGPNALSADALTTVSFTTAVPEPSSFLLLGAGLITIFAAFKLNRVHEV